MAGIDTGLQVMSDYAGANPTYGLIRSHRGDTESAENGEIFTKNFISKLQNV